MRVRLFAFVMVAGLAVVAGCGDSGGDSAPVMPQVVGKRLDVAKSDLERTGIDEEPEILGGGTFGVVKESNWTVCEQLPEAGQAVSEKPRLTVDRSCPDAAGTSSTEPESSSTAPASTPAPSSTPPATNEVLTAANNPDVAALLVGPECGEKVTAFVDKYRGRTIEFDGNIAAMANHDDATTRYDLLVYAGDFSETSAVGPGFQFRDVAMHDLHLNGPNVPDTIVQGTNVHVVAQIDDFDSDSCLLLLKPVSTQVR